MKRPRKFRLQYSGKCEIIANNLDDAIDKLYIILDRIGDVYCIKDNESEIYDVDEE